MSQNEIENLKLAIRLTNERVDHALGLIDACKVAIDGLIDMNKNLCAIIKKLSGGGE